MKRGRPPVRRLDPESREQPVAQDVVPLGARGRIVIPAQVAAGIAWLEHRPGDECHALAIFDEPGSIILHPWDDVAGKVLAKRQRLIENSDFEALRLLQDRFHRIPISADLRITLTLADVTHLGLHYQSASYVYVFREDNQIGIMSPSHRDKLLAEASATFSDLI
jgi:hypothetical protein